MKYECYWWVSGAIIKPVLCPFQTALDNFPEISVVTELKKDGETPAFKVRLSGKAYNKKTMKPYKMPNKVPQVRPCDCEKCPAGGVVASLSFNCMWHQFMFSNIRETFFDCLWLSSFRSIQWTSREHSGFLCTTRCSITSITLTWCVRMRWVCHTPVCCTTLWSAWVLGFNPLSLFGLPADCVSPGACGRTGADGDGPEVSAERGLGRGALWSLWGADQSSAAGLPMICIDQKSAWLTVTGRRGQWVSSCSVDWLVRGLKSPGGTNIDEENEENVWRGGLQSQRLSPNFTLSLL